MVIKCLKKINVIHTLLNLIRIIIFMDLIMNAIIFMYFDMDNSLIMHDTYTIRLLTKIRLCHLLNVSNDTYSLNMI